MLRIAQILLIGIAVVVAEDNSKTSITFCVSDEVALRKCLKMALHTPAEVDLKCQLHYLCSRQTVQNISDVYVLTSNNLMKPPIVLESILYEAYDDDNVIVAVIEGGQERKIDFLPLQFDWKDGRAMSSAIYFNNHRKGAKFCDNLQPAPGAEVIKIMRYNQIGEKLNKKLVCIDQGRLVVDPVTDYKKCSLEVAIPNALMMRKSADDKKKIVLKLMMHLAESSTDDFKLFGKFENKYDNVLFSNEAKSFVRDSPKNLIVEVDYKDEATKLIATCAKVTIDKIFSFT